ncbi:hypothetical protein NX059_001947 [Plenodomus lindquistii]|nr:hypothetical protein NX059_001947 [Plenodomus lindquistii]
MADRFAGAPPNVSGAPTVRRSSKWAGFKLDNIKELAKLKAEHTFYDPSAHSTRRRRKAHLEDYEYFCKEAYGLKDRSDIWDRDQIVDRQMDYLAGVVHTTKGRVGDKIKVTTLYEVKHSLYWWNAHFVPNFSNIFISWHTRMMKWIHQIATHFALTTGSREKTMLTDEELTLMYRVIAGSTKGVLNSKHHYTAWLLAWTTGVRPGSITVTKGYAKGDLLATGAARSTDETLRWSDVEFFKNEGRVCFRITFRYMKGHRDAYVEDFVERHKKFLFLPEASNRFELDLTLILLGLALERRLFPGGLDYVTTTDDLFLKVDPVVNAQAVFVASDQSGQSLPDTPMSYNALNPKLSATCLEAGLPSRNTMYSFRRTRIIESKRAFSLELTKETAGHRPDSDAHQRYDTVDQGDLDMQAYRWGKQSGKSRLELQKIFRQSAVELYKPADEDHEDSLKAEVARRVESRLKESDEYIEMELEVKGVVDETREFLIANTTEDVGVPKGYTAHVIGIYRNLLSDGGAGTAIPGAADIVDALDKVYYRRRLLLKKLRKSLRLAVQAELAKEMRDMAKASKKSQGLKVGAGGASKKLVKEASSAQGEIEASMQEQIQAFSRQGESETAGDDDDDNDDVDVDAIDAYDQAADEAQRGAPAEWDTIPDDEAVRVDLQIGISDDDAVPAEADRLAFLKTWMSKTALPASGLCCHMCRLDPTADEKLRSQLYTRSRLDKHLKSSRHSRSTQLQKAAGAVLAAGGPSADVACPLCPNRKFKASGAWYKHVAKHHPEQTWEAQEWMEMEDSEDAEDAVDDDNDDIEEADSDEDEEPVQSRKGKGKARQA